MSSIATHAKQQRRYERVLVARRVCYQEAASDVADLGVILDLHEAGAFVQMNAGLKAPPPGTRVQLIFRVPGAAGYVHVLAHGTVRWAGTSLVHQTHGFGLEFDTPLSGVRESLKRMLQKR